jgi:hypothetical protein
MPIVVMKDDRTKFIMAKVVPNKGVVDYAVGAVKRQSSSWGTRR